MAQDAWILGNKIYTGKNSDKGQGNGLKLSNIEPGEHFDGRLTLKLSCIEPGQYLDGKPQH